MSYKYARINRYADAAAKIAKIVAAANPFEEQDETALWEIDRKVGRTESRASACFTRLVFAARDVLEYSEHHLDVSWTIAEYNDLVDKVVAINEELTNVLAEEKKAELTK